MHGTRLILMMALLVCAAGCGDGTANNNDTGGNGGGGGTACTVTLAGAITGTFACTTGATYARTILGVSDFDIVKTGDPGFSLGFRVDGKLAAGTLTESSAGVEMAITTASTGDLLWSQSTEDPAHGTVTLDLTSVSLRGDGYTFTVHGTADGTLTASPATPGATGTVTIHVVF